jgi:hypothetical protein
MNQQNYCLTNIKALGFTPTLIEKYLGEPELKRNTKYHSAAPIKLWDKSLVDKICVEIRAELDAQLARRAKSALTREANKDAKYQALKNYLDTYSFDISNDELLELISVSYRTNTISRHVFNNFDLFCNKLAEELSIDEVSAIENTHAEADFTYNKVYPIVREAIKDKPILLNALQVIQTDIKMQEEIELRKLEIVRAQQEELLEFALANFNFIAKNMDINPSKLSQPRGNKAKHWKEAVNQSAGYLWTMFERALEVVEPKFKAYPKPKQPAELKQKLRELANQLLSVKQA